MSVKARKVAIVGCGLVGSSCAYALVNQCVCEEILMIDINEEKAKGEALDLTQSVEYMPLRTKINVGTYKDCKDVDVVIITAGPPPKAGQTRLDTLEVSIKICDSIVNPIMESGFNGFFILVSNPVDIISYYVWKISGLPKQRVIGTGTAIDTVRLKNILSRYLNNIDTRSIQGFSLGEHGDSQMVPWSKITIAGKSFLSLKEENPILSKLDLDSIVKETAKAGWEIYKRKGTTYYGIAGAAVGIIKSIFHDENKVIPVSTLLEGEYGQNDIYMGVPAIIGKNGVESIIDLDLKDEEKEKFNKSALILREYISKIK
ncbi:L-lactate dehydrogenase [Clostridium fallax]|uniref:L-lactate dehydrogenase n=1 Tax=Clostridium fallax TaxID=1533 RepID=A0A1M4T532_9CLOT|nr:L-lactate dehydrogenase [Clostridium fallax]SHE39495.1 L-lactate dehydrogenase [Clostridium fallax]SQB22598.1 L-lactate dehydrogenase [Clostridium fallax]